MKTEIDAKESLKRRVRIASIDFNRVWQLLSRKNPSQFVMIDEFDLPRDCQVVTVHPDPVRAAFIFVLQSSEFDEVEEGVYPPEQEITSRVVELTIKENHDE